MPPTNPYRSPKRDCFKSACGESQTLTLRMARAYVVLHVAIVACLLPLALLDLGLLPLQAHELPKGIESVIDLSFDGLGILAFGSPVGLVVLLILWGTANDKYMYLFLIDLCATVGHWVAVLIGSM